MITRNHGIRLQGLAMRLAADLSETDLAGLVSLSCIGDEVCIGTEHASYAITLRQLDAEMQLDFRVQRTSSINSTAWARHLPSSASRQETAQLIATEINHGSHQP